MTATQCVLSEEILDKIMLLFWERGYFNTSISDLITTTGFNRAALYKNFGGKHGLFIAMLQRFRAKVVVDATAPLRDPEAGMTGIKNFFQQFVSSHSEMIASHGCFMIATASNLSAHEPEVVTVVEEFMQYLRSLFYKNLRWQQAERLLSSEMNTEVLADFLVGNVVGLLTMLRSGIDNHLIENHVKGVDLYLASLLMPKDATHDNLHYI